MNRKQQIKDQASYNDFSTINERDTCKGLTRVIPAHLDLWFA